ncbi:hypothetical protein C2S51_003724 [Perilla frutescens var. frutescens]|nr:hypothetical protein C2S51_003724 [Perilla frutescens var. frutescens]
MGDSSHHHPTPSKSRLRNTGGEIVEVQGGHIVRSTGRKDRHSKVCTAKGPRDRRVRLAAHTAIQFYDVQDRLGYDRPSKAVDWLIKKAKSAIDELAQLPAWHPTASFDQAPAPPPKDLDEFSIEQFDTNEQNQHRSRSADAQNSSFLPPSLDSDAIADTIKSFFPTGAEASSSAMQQFQSFPTTDLLSRNASNNSQDLRLSLQSFQDPILLHHHNEQSQNPTHTHSEPQLLLSGTPLGFDGWPEHHHHQVAELSRFQRFAAWTAGGDGAAASAYMFNVPPAPQPMLQQLLGQNQFLSQRGPLQSSNTSSIRAWMDPSAITIAAADHGQHQHPPIVPIHPLPMSGIGGFSGFHIPARIQGDEEEHDGYSDKPSSASSDSRH